jgi:hypothetical protein
MNNFMKKAAYLAALIALNAVADILLAKLQVVDIDQKLKELTQ